MSSKIENCLSVYNHDLSITDLWLLMDLKQLILFTENYSISHSQPETIQFSLIHCISIRALFACTKE
jgi:hypothetical protein